MSVTTHKKISPVFIFCFMLLIILYHKGYCQEKPLLAVLDFYYLGITERNATLFTDIMTMNIFETGEVHPISRLERTKLLKANGFPLEESKIKDFYPEIASLIYADYLIGGVIKNGKKSCTISLHLYEHKNKRIVKTKEEKYPDYEDALYNIRDFLKDFFSGISFTNSLENISEKVITSLSPVPIKEKILFLYNNSHSTSEWAEIKELIYILIARLTESTRYLPFYTEINRDTKSLTNEDFKKLGESKNCQSVALFEEFENGFRFILYTINREEKLTFPLPRSFYPEEKAKEIILNLTGLPPLPQNVLIKEIDNNLYLEEKIDELLNLEKISSQACHLRIYNSILKSIYTQNLNPNLNMISIESDFSWYYFDYLGIGLGCGFNLGYPGTIDRALNNHPLVYQGEFRIIPFSFRTLSTLGVIINSIVGISIHNISLIESHYECDPIYLTDEGECPFTYSDAGYTLYLKLGLNIGLIYHRTERLALYLDIVTLYFARPIIPHPQYDYIRQYSGDILGVGISISF